MAGAEPYFAPEARLRVREGSSWRELKGGTVEVKATLVNTESGQVEVKLDNRRYEESNGLLSAPPQWAHNALNTFNFGTRFRVDLRYLGGSWLQVRDGARQLRPAAPSSGVGGWIPIIDARVTDMKFAYPQNGLHTLTVVGEDLTSLLKFEPIDNRSFDANLHEDEIVGQILQRAAVDRSMRYHADGFVRMSSPRAEFQPAADATWYAAIRSIASKMDVEFYAAFENPLDPASEVGFYFRRARSQDALETSTIVDLVWSLNLFQFTPTFKFGDVVTEVHVTVSRGGREISTVSDPTVVPRDLKSESGGAATQTAVEVVTAYTSRELGQGYVGPPAPLVHRQNATGLDQARAQEHANASLLDRARSFLTAVIDTPGMPQIRPGIHVNLIDVRPPFEGLYYVTKVVHSFGANGFTTQSTVRRPGYADPANYRSYARSTF